MIVGDEDPRGLPGVSDAVGAGPFDLAGRTALVTGCRRGIGRAAAYALARAGADIAGVSASLEASDEVATEIAGLDGGSVGPLRSAERQAVRELAATVASDFPRLDILVLNAGTIERRPAAEHRDELWDRVLEVNLRRSSCSPGARPANGGAGTREDHFRRVDAVLPGGVTVPGYAASKGGIAQLTKALANEWARMA